MADILSLLPEYMRLEQDYLLADSLEALRAINARGAPGPGELIRVGLRLVPDAFDDGVRPGVRVSERPALAAQLRELPGITVRGCFVSGRLEGLYGRALGAFFRTGYESAKKMTVILPCAMPYLCLENALAALERNRREHPETLEEALTAARIVAMQNQTAFYAKLLIT